MKEIKRYKVKLVRAGLLNVAESSVTCLDGAVAAFMVSLAGLPHEEMHALFLNARQDVVGFSVLSVGGTGGTALTCADLYRAAIVAGARCMVIAHNHPSGDPKPSAEDIAFTATARAAGRLLGIELLDHVVVCPETGKFEVIQ